MNASSLHRLKIVVVGGGTAGWLTAGLLAAKRDQKGQPCFSVCVIEPKDIPPIGVGEGSWPMMRSTLCRIGIGERDFLRTCNASFKQGSKFSEWGHKGGGFYYHPFEPPVRLQEESVVDFWCSHSTGQSFSDFVCRQEYLCERHCAPKLLTSSEYAGVTNYGYHFDAYKMSELLRAHCEANLDVSVVPDKMTGLSTHENGDIAAIHTSDHGLVKGDFFVDCTGFHALLMKGHYGVKTVPINHLLFADRAVTAHVPYQDGDYVQSTTLSTAQEAGWIWDVSLANRRGVGYVHSSRHTGEQQAADVLRRYIGQDRKNSGDIVIREFMFSTGYLAKLWVGNCAAIGLSAGFVEPLEASSIMLTEIAANTLCDTLAAFADETEQAREAFNDKLSGYWKEVIDFLKLHYVLSERSESFWVDNRRAESVPASLQVKLEKWRRGEPVTENIQAQLQLFPHESYQYVLRGMTRRADQNTAAFAPAQKYPSTLKFMEQNTHEKQRLAALLPTNQEFIASLGQGRYS